MDMVAFNSPFIFFLFLLLLLFFLKMQLIYASECPLDLSGSNFTLASSLCSSPTREDRAKCCRYINALIAISVARYANVTSNLGVTSDLAGTCLHTIAETLALYGVTRNATVFCGFGTKIPVDYECQGRTTVNQMIQSPRFTEVATNCRVPLTGESGCKQCVNAGIGYLRSLVGAADNLTFSTCRDATFATLASQVDNASVVDIAGCFFGVQRLLASPGGLDERPSQSILSPEASPSPPVAASPGQLTLSTTMKEKHHPYHLTLVPGIGIVVAATAIMLLIVLVILICRKSRELNDCDALDKTTSKAFPQSSRKFQEGPSSMFRKFSYKDTKKATNNFTTVIGQGGFCTVYKAEFDDGLVVAVKRMDKVSEQAEDEFCRELELLARLHHRHLVALRGFCIKKHERFLMYEYMENGSLKDHLHNTGASSLSWHTRIQIAIDVANALEYLHFYCDPPLCHRDIKSSNILLDANFVAKVADFGLAHASRDGSICFEPVNSDIKGTPGYMDPEYVITQEVTEKSDVYSYGVVLLELLTARRAIQDDRNLVEWSQRYFCSDALITELVDNSLGESYDFDQLQTLVAIAKWCTQREGKARPSMKQVLRLLYERADPTHGGFIQSIEDEEREEGEGGRGGRSSRGGKTHRGGGDEIFHSGEGRYLASSSSTTRSYCSRSFLLDNGSPQSPHNVP